MHLVKSNKMEVWSSEKSGKASTESQNAELVMVSICKKKARPKVIYEEWEKSKLMGGWLNSSSIIHLEMSSRLKLEKSGNVKERDLLNDFPTITQGQEEH